MATLSFPHNLHPSLFYWFGSLFQYDWDKIVTGLKMVWNIIIIIISNLIINHQSGADTDNSGPELEVDGVYHASVSEKGGALQVALIVVMITINAIVLTRHNRGAAWDQGGRWRASLRVQPHIKLRKCSFWGDFENMKTRKLILSTLSDISAGGSRRTLEHNCTRLRAGTCN